MNFGGHLITGWLISQSRPLDLPQRRFITLMAIAPDIDGAFFFIPSLNEQWHRTFGHNVFFAALVPLAALLILGQRRGRAILPFAYLAMASHFVLDLLVTGWWEMRPLWPVSEWGIIMSRWIPEHVMMYWIQLGLLAVLIGVAIVIFRRTRRTPLEIISPGFERFILTFVTYPFRLRCAQCGNRAFYQHPITGSPVCGRHMMWRLLFQRISSNDTTVKGIGK